VESEVGLGGVTRARVDDRPSEKAPKDDGDAEQRAQNPFLHCAGTCCFAKASSGTTGVCGFKALYHSSAVASLMWSKGQTSA